MPSRQYHITVQNMHNGQFARLSFIVDWKGLSTWKEVVANDIPSNFYLTMEHHVSQHENPDHKSDCVCCCCEQSRAANYQTMTLVNIA